MNKKVDVVQELKSERVQEEMMPAEEPIVLWLKSERVQEPTASLAAGGPSSSFFELIVNPCERVTIGLQELQVTITLEGLTAG